jgi:hypothetical protein
MAAIYSDLAILPYHHQWLKIKKIALKLEALLEVGEGCAPYSIQAHPEAPGTKGRN